MPRSTHAARAHHAVRQDLAPPRRARARRRPHAALRRLPPAAGRLGPGVRDAAPARARAARRPSARSPRRTTTFRRTAAASPTCATRKRRAWRRRCTTTRRARASAMFGLDDARQGIVHVVGPEQGLSQPGMLIVCGDSHTSTHGAIGALAFGIGASEVAHVLATQTIWQRRPKTMRIVIDGALGVGVTAKDVILAIIAKIGAAGAAGHAIEYAGSTVRALSMEGALHAVQHVDRSGRALRNDRARRRRRSPISPDGRSRRRCGVGSCRARMAGAAHRRRCARSIARSTLDASRLEPMVTWGNSPEDALPITGRVPDPRARRRMPNGATRCSARSRTWASSPGTPLADVADRSRVHRLVHELAHRGPAQRRGASSPGAASPRACEAWVVPGSGLVKAQAEARGPRSRVRRRRLPVALRRMLDVPRHQRRSRRARRALRVDVQPQLRRPAGTGFAHASDEPGDGGRRRGHRPPDRRAHAAGAN